MLVDLNARGPDRDESIPQAVSIIVQTARSVEMSIVIAIAIVTACGEDQHAAAKLKGLKLGLARTR